MENVFILVEMTGAEALIKALIDEKVEGVFGLPGGANLPIYDTLHDSEIRHILAPETKILIFALLYCD